MINRLIVILICLVVSSYAYTYIETDPTDSVQLKAFQTAAVEKVDCTDRTKLVEALQRDTSASGTYKHGSCCLNSHHVICQDIQSQIRSKCSDHKGKGDTSTDTTGTNCPA
jgi:hypothetical protein